MPLKLLSLTNDSVQKSSLTNGKETSSYMSNYK